jgi:hypothetical protein
MIDDDESRFPAPVIKEKKQRHEDKATEPYVISDNMAERIVLLLGGSVAGAVIAEIAKGLGHVVGAIANIAGSPQQNKKTKEEEALETALRRSGKILRYAPKGSFAYFANKSVPLGIAGFFARLFAASGWRELDKKSPRDAAGSRTLDDSSFAMAFFLNDPHQVSNAKQAIDEVFREFGFEPVKNRDGDEFFSPEQGFRAFLIVGAHR